MKNLVGNKPKMKANISELDNKYFFCYRMKIQKEQTETNAAIANCIVGKCRLNSKVLLEEGKLVTIKVDKVVLRRFTIKDDTKHVVAFKYQEKSY